MSVLWEMTPSFEVIPDKTWFGRTLIRSAYALTYYQAQRLVDGQDADAVPVDVLVRVLWPELVGFRSVIVVPHSPAAR